MKLTTTPVLLAFSTAITLSGCGCGSNNTASGSGTTNGGGSTNGSGVKLTGAGSSFVAPAMQTWLYEYKSAKGVEVNYQAKGSGAGISQYKEGTVDFGATDAPLNDKDLASMPTPTAQFPVAAGCEVLAYNIPGVASGLKFSPDVITDIFLGKIKSWDDPKIAADNAGLKLPHQDIAVVYRSDSSGTTYIFTDYLSSVSPAWKSGPGQGKSVVWPVGTGGKGNDGVASLVKQTPGSIGYVELAYAVQAKLNYGPIKNQAGNFVTPSIESTSAAADGAAEALKKDIRTSIVNVNAKDAYPICGMTYVILSKTPKDAAKGAATVDFLTWDLTEGQTKVAALQYSPLPASVVELGKKALSEVKVSK